MGDLNLLSKVVGFFNKREYSGDEWLDPLVGRPIFLLVSSSV